MIAAGILFSIMLDADEHYDKEAGRLHLATELPTSMATQSTSENGLVTGHRTEEPATEEEMPRTTVEQDVSKSSCCPYLLNLDCPGYWLRHACRAESWETSSTGPPA